MARQVQTSLLILAFLWYGGCTTAVPLTRDDIPPGGVDREVFLALTDSSVVKLEPGDLYCDVLRPSDLILGRGKRTKRFEGSEQAFIGTFEASLIDSMKVMNSEGTQFVRVYFQDSTVVQMKSDEYVRIMPVEGTGLWVLNAHRTKRGETIFTGKIAYDEIAGIEARKLSAVGIAVIVVSAAAVIVGGVALGKNLPTGPLLPPK